MTHQAPRRRSKYRNVPTVVDGERFDSKAEAARWHELLLLQEQGEIRSLRRQPAFELAPSVKFFGTRRASPALRYVADFGYTISAQHEPILARSSSRTRGAVPPIMVSSSGYAVA